MKGGMEMGVPALTGEVEAGVLGDGTLGGRTLDDRILDGEGAISTHVVGNENDGDPGASGENQNAEEGDTAEEDEKKVEKDGDPADNDSSKEDENAENEIYDKNQLSYADDDVYVDEEDPKILQKRTAIRADIRTLYLSGTPLFTRQTLQDLSRSLKALPGTYTPGKKKFIYVKALNGAMVGFKMETGRLFISRPEREEVL